MVVCIKGGEEDESDATPPRKISAENDTLADVFVPKGSPSSMNNFTHVVIVMDASRGFSQEPLRWALDNVIQTRCTHITLLGVMPWVPLALSCKTWLDVWTFDEGDLPALKCRSVWKSYEKVRGIIEQCEQKGVVPCIKLAVGHPLRLVVLEQTTNLHATLVVLDRHLRKNKTFFARRLPSSVVIMKNDGEVDMLKIQSSMDLSPAESPATEISTPQVILSEALSHLLN